jgi:hypothetical protein
VQVTFWGWRHGGVVLIAVTALLGAGATAARAESFTGACDACVAGYSGTFTETQVSTESDPMYPVTTTIKLSWSQQAVNNGNGTSTTQPETVTGTYTVTSDAPDSPVDSCQIGADPEAESLFNWNYVNMNQASAVYDVAAGPPDRSTSAARGPATGRGMTGSPFSGPTPDRGATGPVTVALIRRSRPAARTR